MDALGKISDRALFHHDAFGDRIAAFEHISDLIECVTMAGRCPASAAGAADVQEIVARRIVLPHQRKFCPERHRACCRLYRPGLLRLRQLSWCPPFDVV